MLKSNNGQSCIERLESRRLLSTTTQTLAVGNVLYTAVDAESFNTGSDLYRSNLDGSNQTLLQHWQSGEFGPTNLFALNSKLLFSADYADQPLTGRELWASDGTTAGTKLIADFYEQAAGSNPHDFHLVNGRAVFLASNNSANNLQLYTTDGTTGGSAIISPFMQDTYYSPVANVSYSATAVTWDYYQNRLEMNQRLTSNAQLGAGGTATWSVLYTEPNDGVVRISANSDTVSRTLAASEDNAGNTFLTYNGETLRFRTADVQSMSLGDTFGDDAISVDSSIRVPVTISSGAGNDTISGGGRLTTLDLTTHRGEWNADNTVYTNNEVVTLNDSGGQASFDDGSRMTIHGVIGTIIGGYGNDQITGSSRSETLLGGHGDDTIIGNGGGDSIDGGAGADHITASQSHDTIIADTADTITNTDPSDTGGSGSGDNSDGDGTGGTGVGNSGDAPTWSYANGVVHITGTSGDDDIRLVPSGTSLKLILDGSTSKVLASKVSTVVIDAGDGDDFIWLRNMSAKSKIYGGAGDDAITTSDGKDRIYGGDGNDSVESGGNHDTIYGEAGDDRVAGGDSSDFVSGGAGKNVIRGEGGFDHISYTELDDVHGNRGDKMDIDSMVG